MRELEAGVADRRRVDERGDLLRDRRGASAKKCGAGHMNGAIVPRSLALENRCEERAGPSHATRSRRNEARGSRAKAWPGKAGCKWENALLTAMFARHRR